MVKSHSGWRAEFKKQGALQLFVWLGIVYLIIFSVIPMFGLIIAFKDYTVNQGIRGMFTSEWVGLKYFKEFVTDYQFGNLVRNTVALSLLKLIFSFPAPILLALMINEIKNVPFKRILQTASYLPHFISWVIISSIVYQFLSKNGVINSVLLNLGIVDQAIPFTTSPDLFWGMAVALDMWKEMGWWAIVFLAALAGINDELYEAAQIDGASRLQRILHITLPGIKSTIAVVLVMSLGNLFGGGLSGSNFEQSYLLGNALNASTSKVIQSYVFEVGLAQGRFAYATAVGLIQSVISLILILSGNFISKKIEGNGLF